MSYTATAQTTIPRRPDREYQFPVAQEHTVDGVVLKCFEKDGQGWKTVGHMVVDYRAFFPWAEWADSQIGQVENLVHQRAMWMAIAKSAEQANSISSNALLEERELRLSVEREKRVVPWLLGGAAFFEMIAIAGLSIWGAAK